MLMSFVMILQLLIVLAALYVGSRYGSLALGAISGIGLAILVLGFGMKPGNPPTDVIYIIIAAVTCDIALKKGIRPERPCAVASVASQVGITCSLIAAAVASFVIISNDNGFDINNLQHHHSDCDDYSRRFHDHNSQS